METNNERADFDAACRPCDECGIDLLPGEAVNPPEMAEKFCVLCWPAIEADERAADEAEAVPVPADAGRTTRIPVQSMASMVWGAQ